MYEQKLPKCFSFGFERILFSLRRYNYSTKRTSKSSRRTFSKEDSATIYIKKKKKGSVRFNHFRVTTSINKTNYSSINFIFRDISRTVEANYFYFSFVNSSEENPLSKSSYGPAHQLSYFLSTGAAKKNKM